MLVLVKFGACSITRRLLMKKMVDIIKFRKDALIEKRNRFKNEEEINNHINFIEEEIKISKKDSRMLELRNWLNIN